MRIGPLCAIALSLAACGDNIAGLTLDELDGSRRAAQCERLVRCGLFTDATLCRDYFRADVDPGLSAAVNAGKVRFDPLAASACNKAVAEISCDVTARDVRVVPDSCARVLVGLVPTEGTCAQDRECGSSHCSAEHCARDVCCVGGCEPYEAPAPLDAPCTAKGGCVEGSSCGADQVCHEFSKAGGTCANDFECEYGLGCVGATELQAGACRVLPRLGEACPYLRCAEIGARCSVDQICVPFGTAGSACSSDSECSEFDQCDTGAQRCVDLPTLGMPCVGRCSGEAYCDFTSGKCGPPQPVAVPCTADDQCASEYCEEGPIFDQCGPQAVCF